MPTSRGVGPNKICAASGFVARFRDAAGEPGARRRVPLVTSRAVDQRLSFLDAAEAVLQSVDRPLTPGDIVARAAGDGLLRTSGATPSQTLKAKLSTDILRRRDRSRFMRTAKNEFGLRSWRSRYPEYHAERFQKALLDEDVVVFPIEVLHGVIPGPGVHQLTESDTEVLLDSIFPMKRSDAELDYSVIQLVSAFLVYSPDKRIATYKRTKRLPESRLHGYFSLLFGGHLNPDDVPPLFSIFHPELGELFIQRELSEELRMSEKPRLKYIGVLYDDARDVSKQHLGVLYEVYVPEAADVEIGERGFLQQLRFEHPAEIASRSDEFENWSLMVLRDHVLGRSLERG
jgi:predicted NUDIX family phosphoesterase